MIFIWFYPFLSLSHDSMQTFPTLLNVLLDRGTLPGMDQRKKRLPYTVIFYPTYFQQITAFVLG